MKDIICFDEGYCSKINTCTYVNNGLEGNTCELTELHIVAYRNEANMAVYLLAKDANVNCKNKCGKTPLLIAVQNRNMEVAEVLLTSGANVNIPDFRGESPLQAALDENNEEMIDLLIAYCMGG
jgi:ankyrin repeat protein